MGMCSVTSKTVNCHRFKKLRYILKCTTRVCCWFLNQATIEDFAKACVILIYQYMNLAVGIYEEFIEQRRSESLNRFLANYKRYGYAMIDSIHKLHPFLRRHIKAEQRCLYDMNVWDVSPQISISILLPQKGWIVCNNNFMLVLEFLDASCY